jgi:hypothetical protein
MKERYEKRSKLREELYKATSCGIQYGGFPCATCMGSILNKLKILSPNLISDRTSDAVFRFRGDYTPTRLAKVYSKDFADIFVFSDKEMTKIIDNLLKALEAYNK